MELQFIRKVDCAVDGRYLVSSEGEISERYSSFLEKIYYLDYYEYVLSDDNNEVSIVVEDVLYIDPKTFKESNSCTCIIYDEGLENELKQQVTQCIIEEFKNGNIISKIDKMILSYNSNKEKYEIQR